MLRPLYDVDVEVPRCILHDETAIGIDVDCVDIGAGEQAAQDVVV
jgi:hypothetical protein